jgi:hypothetical protein
LLGWRAGAAFTLGFAIPEGEAYFSLMFEAFDFCLPTRSTKVPDGPDWLHEIKYDGYRLRVERHGDGVRLITRGGYNWTDRYPWIVEAALKNRQAPLQSIWSLNSLRSRTRARRSAAGGERAAGGIANPLEKGADVNAPPNGSDQAKPFLHIAILRHSRRSFSISFCSASFRSTCGDD